MAAVRKAAKAFALLMIISGCAARDRAGHHDVGVSAANYTENFITDFYLSSSESGSGRFAGTSIKEFSRGGTGGGVCCFSLAKPGHAVRIEWYTGQRNDRESRWVRHSAVVQATGATSDDPDSNITLIVRFFPEDKVEVEYVAQEEKPASSRNPRFDSIFTGRRVMRHVGE
ncbi:DUF3304 domain-containing protein [Burkholderia sp. WSM2232]|uniref:DUF3304 domain-containing protein n=1 Tax=Burkholderia sp. WSM2232 TaxID=944436 RepID=UPI0018DB1EBA|nr:DUF3304 domain-containing protein [Burkholderia sp. WSM2232]